MSKSNNYLRRNIYARFKHEFNFISAYNLKLPPVIGVNACDNGTNKNVSFLYCTVSCTPYLKLTFSVAIYSSFPVFVVIIRFILELH